MAKIGDLVSKLQIGERTFKNPEWWSTQHKLKCQIKEENILNPRLSVMNSYKVCDENSISSDEFVRHLQSELDNPKYKEYAPWSNIFDKAKNLIVFKK